MSNLELLVDELSSLTLIEASQLARMLREKWGITETLSPVMVPANRVVSTIETAIEKDVFDVVLKDVGARRIEVIKTVRQLTTLGLAEAKKLVETPSAIVLSGVSNEVATEATRKLFDAGAISEIV